DRANDWATRYVNRAAGPDIKADLDNTFDAVREQFGYKRKDLDVSAERDGVGFIRTPDFEYTVTVNVNPDEPSEVVWRREVGRLTLTREAVTIEGRAGATAGLLDQFLTFLRKFAGVGEPKALPEGGT